MFPIKDTVPVRRIPLVNWLIITANVLVFMYESLLPPDQLNHFIYLFGLTPSYLVRHWIPDGMTILTSMFLHGGWLHLISNMWALYIFGDNVEDRVGHFRYLVFYLLCGVIAAATQVISAVDSPVPMVGASGALSGILGAYLVLFPRARVITLVPLFFLPWFVEIPVFFYLGLWFLSQLFNGMFTLAVSGIIGTYGGVAWWAHIGGFGTGLVLVKFFEQRPTYDDRYSE